MLSTDRLKELACAAIDEKAGEIISIAQDILAHPEPGFSEVRTSQVVAKKFTELGIEHERGLAITGVKGRFAGVSAHYWRWSQSKRICFSPV